MRIIFLILVPPSISNSVLTVGLAGQNASLNCGSTGNVAWFATNNEAEGSFDFLDFTNPNKFIINNQILTITSLTLDDQEYYACANLDSNQIYVTAKVFHLYVKGNRFVRIIKK